MKVIILDPMKMTLENMNENIHLMVISSLMYPLSQNFFLFFKKQKLKKFCSANGSIKEKWFSGDPWFHLLDHVRIRLLFSLSAH